MPRNVTVRVPKDILDKLNELKSRGFGTSAALFRLVRTASEAEAEMGDWWWKVEQAAAEQHVGVGVILGRLARESQERRR